MKVNRVKTLKEEVVRWKQNQNKPERKRTSYAPIEYDEFMKIVDFLLTRVDLSSTNESGVSVVEDMKIKLEGYINQVGKVRDEMREFASEVDTIVESLDSAESDLEDAKNNLDSAIDNMSQYV